MVTSWGNRLWFHHLLAILRPFSGNLLFNFFVWAVINDWVKILDKEGQVDTFIQDFEKAFDPRLMNFFKANYLVIVLAERHSGG